MELSFTPTLDSEEGERRLARLLVSGSLLDQAVASRIESVARSFRSYSACYPLPLWAPGLLVDHEMRALTEALLPMRELRGVFDLVARRGCRFPPLLAGTYLHTSPSWLDFLHRLGWIAQADPAAILRRVAVDGELRRSFLFALFLPRHFGASFQRYHGQLRWIRQWLKEHAGRLGGPVRVLDAACGSGEGTYDVAAAVAALGGTGEIVGSTVEHIELFAAAHAFFPHDRERQARYRSRVAPLLEEGNGISLRFDLEDVATRKEGERYHLVLCNGLLGGPLMHEERQLAEALGALASRVEPGGVLLAADRFHEGWRLRVPARSLMALMREHGLVPLDVAEGVGAERPRT